MYSFVLLKSQTRLIVDLDILKRCANNDQRAIKQLYEHCFHKLMPLCLRYHVNQEDARSSLNIAFMKIIQNLPSMELSTLNFNAWSKRITANTLIDEYRKRKHQDDHYLKKETERELDAASNLTTNEGLENLNYDALLTLIYKLPENTRVVFNLFVIEGYAHNEIAEELDIPIGTSKWHLSNARKLLKEMLEKTTINTHKNEFVGERY